MMEFFKKSADFVLEHWLLLLSGLVLAAALWAAIRLAQGRPLPLVSRLKFLAAPLHWYAETRWARQLTVNVLGVALILWGVQTFTGWVQPALTPDMLFTPPVVGPQAVEVAMAEERTLEDRVTYTGTVYPYEDAWIYARVDGWVEELDVYPGDVVEKGQVLTALELSALEPQLRHTRAQVTFWKAEFERDRTLLEAGAISGSQFDKTREQYEVAQAQLQRVQTDIAYATLEAPMDGIVSERKIYPGVYVKRGDPVLKVDQLDRVRVQFEVAEEDLLWIKPGTTAYVRFPQADPQQIKKAFADLIVEDGDPGTGPDAAAWEAAGPTLKTEVAAVFPMEDPQTRTGTVEVRLPNPGATLKTNTYAVAQLVRRKANPALVIPVAALQPDGDPVVFVGPAFSEEGGAQRREVKLGLVTGRYAQVLEGINPGEFVITKGNRVVTDGQTVRVVRREGGF